MRRAILAALAAVMLSGCISTIESAYDQRARDECDQEASNTQRGACYDRVDQNRREHR